MLKTVPRNPSWQLSFAQLSPSLFPLFICMLRYSIDFKTVGKRVLIKFYSNTVISYRKYEKCQIFFSPVLPVNIFESFSTPKNIIAFENDHFHHILIILFF